MTQLERNRWIGILRKIERTEEHCSKVKTMQMQLIINRDALLYIKAAINGYLLEDKT